jgi:glycosyltransferase involved in cell wall biosynthesis
MNTTYALITPAHNEDMYIEQLIEAVLTQTIRPMRWVIVDDASTDRTGQIVRSYCQQYNFVYYHRIEPNTIVSYYSRRTHVCLEGFKQIKHDEYDFIGVLDADITLPPDYYENILCEFERNPKLGVASGIYIDKVDGRYRKVIRSNISTSGGIQMFRRECYEQIGGYKPLRYGGDDSLAEYMARMNGWQTSSFPAHVAVHHRPMGTRGGVNMVKVRLRNGLSDYYLGSNIIFVLMKSLWRCLIERPLVIGGLARMCGFLAGYFSNHSREVPSDVVKYIRKEQMCRLLGVKYKPNA